MTRMRKIIVTSLFLIAIVLFLSSCRFFYTIHLETGFGIDYQDLRGMYGQPYELPIPERPGYDFLGWYLDEDFQIPHDLQTVIKGRTTLFAAWEKHPVTLDFAMSGGPELSPLSGFYEDPLTMPAPPVWEGHIFLGWYADPDYHISWKSNAFPADDTTIYSKWVSIEPECMIRKAIEAEDGEEVTVRGTVIGVSGDDAYLHDGECGIYVRDIDVEEGMYVAATGRKFTVNGQFQLWDVNFISILHEQGLMPEGETITKFADISRQSSFYSFAQLRVLSSPAYQRNMMTIRLSDDLGGKITLQVNLSLDPDELSEIRNLMPYLRKDSLISLTDVVSGYQDGYSLELFHADSVSLLGYHPDAEILAERLNKEEEPVAFSPSGVANALIIPIAFPDVPYSETDYENLRQAFFGNPEETGWESVASYYQKSSYGQFRLEGNIRPPFIAPRNLDYYISKAVFQEHSEFELLKEALSFYDSVLKLSMYDTNHDSHIDGIYFVYLLPPSQESRLFRPYTNCRGQSLGTYDKLTADYYIWAGIDPTVLIHETGHLLGLDDYYDTDLLSGPAGGLGGADMMDSSSGDHHPFSKIMLGWVNPLVITDSVTLMIGSFSETGDVLLLASAFTGSYFSEYYLLELYTPEGLNQTFGFYPDPGIRLTKVDARIEDGLGKPKNPDGYYSFFSFNNSDTEQKLLSTVEADGNDSIENRGLSEAGDLFAAERIFGYQTDIASDIPYRITIEAIDNGNATLKIEYFPH